MVKWKGIVDAMNPLIHARIWEVSLDDYDHGTFACYWTLGHALDFALAHVVFGQFPGITIKNQITGRLFVLQNKFDRKSAYYEPRSHNLIQHVGGA